MFSILFYSILFYNDCAYIVNVYSAIIYCDSGQISHLQVWCDGRVTVAVVYMLVVNHCSNIGNDVARGCTLLLLP